MSVARRTWFSLVWLLLGAARRRVRARVHAQAVRGRSRSPGSANALALIGSLFFQFMLAAAFLILADTTAEIDLESAGKLVVHRSAVESIAGLEQAQGRYRALAADTDALSSGRSSDAELAASKRVVDNARKDVATNLKRVAENLARSRGGDEEQWLKQLEQRQESLGPAGFAAATTDHLRVSGAAAFRVVALLMILWWLSLVLQGEGVTIDTTRRRHPMWEWYLGFPIPQSAVFVAEALAPLLSNPFLLTSPVLLAALVGIHTGSVLAGVCALPIGVPLAIAAAIWAKALEVLIMLRSPQRNRGGWFVLLAAAGFLVGFFPLVLIGSSKIMYALLANIVPLTDTLPSGEFLLGDSAAWNWLRAMGLSLTLGAILSGLAILLLRFAAARGLEGGFGGSESALRSVAFAAARPGRWAWLHDPLLRKEWLWLKRDRGALFQLIGIPLLLVALQFFNLQNMLRDIELTWYKLAGFVVGMGGYMLFISGPRALLSEGPALALTVSWPRDLEETLRMKVRLLFSLVTAMVWLCLLTLMWMFPADAYKLAAVALAWPLFGLSVAEKAVTLIRAPSQSGEPEPLPQSQFWLTGFGNLTFAIALFTAQWHLAVAAIAMNWVFAGAIWQGFRVRLAFLFDPDSLPELRPPTVLSSVIAIVALMEFGLLFTLPLLLFTGVEGAPFARAMGYGGAAAVISLVVVHWHAKRGVGLRDILCIDDSTRLLPANATIIAVVLGGLLGFIAVAYQELLLSAPWPEVRQELEDASRFFADSSNARIAFAIMAIGIAPWVEEFLFRGLLFRALLSEWGVRSAILASSAFFAILHPVIAWPMVFALGAASALLFMRTRALLPCVVLHTTYNAVLIALSFARI